MNNKMVKCDACGRMISAAGIKIKKFREGEYEVSFFSCPHCGHDYHVNTTDEQQRKLLRKQREWYGAAVVGRQKRFPLKKLEEYIKNAKKAQGKAQKRVPELNKIGKALLEGNQLDDILQEE